MSRPEISIGIVVTSALSRQRRKAEKLARELGLTVTEHCDDRFRYQLVYTDYRLELQHNPAFLGYRQNAVFAEFLQGRGQHRRLATATLKNPLARAAGLKPGRRPRIVDATAGLGMDGMVLAKLGCLVKMVERNPIVHALLADGIERAQQDSALGEVIEERVTLECADAAGILAQDYTTPDTILLDPMYPTTSRAPLNRKEMRLLRAMVGDDSDASLLFEAAFAHAKQRVVVKRPKAAENLVSYRLPSHTIAMKSGRFDVYLKI